MELQQNIDLKPYNTFGISVSCDYFTEVDDERQLFDVRSFLHENPMPFLIIGGGSNLLFTGDFHGLVILNRLEGKQKISEEEGFIYIESASGESWEELADYCVANGWGGMENLACIPGTAGASVVQNIGAYGVEAAGIIYAVYAFDLLSGNTFRFSGEECEFGYRDSIFKKSKNKPLFITKIVYRLERAPRIKTSYGIIKAELKRIGIKRPGIGDIRDVVMSIRNSKLPDVKKIGSAGSFFKNPVIEPGQATDLLLQYPEMPYYPLQTGHIKLAAGWLIDQCGLKGYRTGDAGVHEKQALVLINYGKASGHDIYELSRYIQQTVLQKFDVKLEPEVVIIKNNE